MKLKNYITLSEPNAENTKLISLQDAKDFLKVLGTRDDDQIKNFISYAVDFAEKFTGIQLSRKYFVASYEVSAPIQMKIHSPLRFIKEIEKIEVSHSGNKKNINPYNFDFDTQTIFFPSQNIISLDQASSYEVKIYFYSCDLKEISQFINIFGLKNAILTHTNILYKRRMPTATRNDLQTSEEIEKLYKPYRLFRL
jgi:hypothetical protein